MIGVPVGSSSDQTGKAVAFDVYDAQALARQALSATGFDARQAQITADASGWYHPGQSGVLRLGPAVALAEFGLLHPRVLRDLDLDGPVVAVELFLDAVPRPKAQTARARAPYAPPALQPLVRDFAFVIKQDASVSRLVRAVAGADKSLIQDVSVFDVYTGTGLADDEQSIAVEVVLQPVKASLTEEDLAAFTAKVIAAAQKAVGGRLRG